MKPLVCNILVADSSYLPPNFLSPNNIVKADVNEARNYIENKLDELLDWLENDPSCTTKPEYQIIENYKKTSISIVLSVPDSDDKYIEVVKFTAKPITKDTGLQVVCDLNGDNCFVTCTTSYDYNQLAEFIHNDMQDVCDEYLYETLDGTAVPVQECNFDEMYVKINESYTRRWFIVTIPEENDSEKDKEIQVDLPV